MRAVREVNPSARLIQTDDLGKVFSTPKLAYQAEFENERRWLTYDLLCGRVDRDHAMWDYLLWTAGEAELHWFLENTCPPDVMGINHYLSGERYLDHEYERYPDCTHGGNGREQYADVLAARVRDEGAAGPQALLMEAWKRYGRPIAVTECHNGCTREEQLRWFLEVWRAAQNARRQGVNVIAVTAWSLLGAFDWDHLVTRNDQHYESGVYDIRSTPLRPTALAPLIRDLAAQKRPDHPLLGVAGWWKRSQRLIYGFSRTDAGELKLAGLSHRFAEQMQPGNVPPVLITGSRGTLGYAFARICATRGIPYRLLSREDLDIADGESVCRTIGELAPWAVINAAGYVRVDDAEQQWVRCYRENTLGPAVLAFECGRRNIQLMTFSSDLVFGGTNTRPYVESDDTAPLSFYGLSKAEAEQRVLKALPSALIVRSSAFFGPWDEHNFVLLALRTLALNQEFRAAADAMVSPTYVPDLVNGCLDLLIDGESGIWHVANEGEISWATLAETAAEHAKVPTKMLVRCELQDLKLPARRPRYSVLGSQRALLLPKLDDALRRFMVECEKTWNPTRYESNERLAA
jgi:dTDP-4-dehydrorhamnose reductase